MDRSKTPRHLLPIFLAFLLGAVLVPLYNLLDWLIYFRQAPLFLGLRLIVSAILIAFAFLVYRTQERYLSLLVFLGVFLTSLAISLMCFLSGEGFASPYYVGLLQVVIVSALLFPLDKTVVLLIITASIVQHFVLLSFLPFRLQDFFINLFGVGVFTAIGILIHRFFHNLVQEIRTLKGILPICSRCKKIRDDQGYWHQVERYIRSRTEAEFSHGLCPDCLKALYPDLAGRNED